MVSQPDYDLVLQLHCDALRDVQTRVLNASLLTNLALTSPISRMLTQTVSPFQMKAHWVKPELHIADGMVALSADLAGGARYSLKGINLTIEGQVSTECRPRAVVNDSGQPMVTLTAPSPLDLNLADLELSYHGDDELPTWVDSTIERTLLRPVLCAQLMAPLANLPLNYLPDAVPLRCISEPHHENASADGLPLADMVASCDPDSESLTLAMRCVAPSATPASPPNLLSHHSSANIAVALSETALNRTLSWLCARGLATGTTAQAGGVIAWRWSHALARFTDHAIRLTGRLWQGTTVTAVDAEMHCFLTPSAQLSVHLSAPDHQPAHADVLLDAWAQLLSRIFFPVTRLPGPAHPATTEPDSAQLLRQRFVIPGTDLSTEAPAVGLKLRDGYLVAWYAIAPDEQPLTLTLKENKPAPTIIQPVVPLQDAPGAPVTTQLVAILANSSQPPYDYAWRADQEPHPGGHHSPTITVTKTPPPTMGTAAPQQLTTVTLKVIDILGRVGEAEIDAMYCPAAAQQEKEQEQEARQDHEKEAITAPGNPGPIRSAAQYYQKWTDRHKAATVVLRVTGSAIVSAILAFITILGSANPADSAAPSQGPTPTTSATAPPSADPTISPGHSTPGHSMTNTQTDTTGPTGPQSPTNPADPGSPGTGTDSGGGGRPSGGTTSSGEVSGRTDLGHTETTTSKLHLTVQVSEGGSVTGSGISCPPTCSAPVAPGEPITLTAQAGSYYNFDGWDFDSPGTCTITTPTCTMTINGDTTVSANFGSQIAPFIGTWNNIDPDARNIPQVRLTQTSPSTATLQVWGACSPTWCDWGTTTATLSAGRLEAFYNQGFATRNIVITLSNGQLAVQIHNHFTDDSGRPDYDSTNTMNRTD